MSFPHQNRRGIQYKSDNLDWQKHLCRIFSICLALDSRVGFSSVVKSVVRNLMSRRDFGKLNVRTRAPGALLGIVAIQGAKIPRMLTI